MPLNVVCACGQNYRVEERFSGQQHPCGVCGRAIQIPFGPEAVGPSHDFADDPAPSERGGLAALLLLLATLAFVVVLGGGLVAAVWFLSQQPADAVAEGDPPPPAPPPPPPPARRDDPPPPPPKADDDPKPPKKEDDPPPPRKSDLPPPSDRSWQGHSAAVLAVGVDPTGKTVWTASGGLDDRDRPALDSTLRRWDAVSGKEVDRLELADNGVAAVAFDARLRRAAVAVPGKALIDLYDLSSKKPLVTLDGHLGAVRCLAFSGDGKRLVSGGEDKLVIVWDLASNKALRKLSGHGNAVVSVSASRDGSRAVSGGIDLSARLWDLDRGEALGELAGHKDVVWATAFSADGSLALSGGGLQQAPPVFVAGARDHDVRCWDVGRSTLKGKGQPLPGPVSALAFSPDARRYLAGGHDGRLRLWQLGSNKEAKRFDAHTGRVHAVAFFPDGRRAVSVSEDRSIRLWDLPADVPDLVRDLGGDKPAARKAALEELAKLGPDAKPAVPALFASLPAGDDAWKQGVRDVLRSLSPLDKEHLPRLEVLLKDRRDAEARRFAAEELGKMGQDARPAARSLLTAVADLDVEVRRKAAAALAPVADEVGSAAFEPLLVALRDKDEVVRAHADKAVEKLGPPGAEQLELLRKLLSDEGVALRRFAVRALGGMGRPALAALEDMGAAAKDDAEADVRQLALEAMTKLAPRDARTVAAARAGLGDRSPEVARAAAKGLEAAADPPGLVAALEHDDAEVRKTGDEGLKSVRLAKEHLPLLTKLVASTRSSARLRGIEAIGELGADGAEAVPALRKAMATGGDKEQQKLLATFANLGPAAKAAGGDVAKLLAGRDAKGKFEVCEVLLKIDAPEVKAAVRPLMDQLKPAKTEEVDDEAASAERAKARAMLVRIGRPAVGPLLVAVEGEFSGGKGDDATLNGVARLAIVKALSEMGGKAGGGQTLQVLARLRQARNEPFPGVREEATRAYSRVQVKE